jgi:hypothetical protein
MINMRKVEIEQETLEDLVRTLRRFKRTISDRLLRLPITEDEAILRRKKKRRGEPMKKAPGMAKKAPVKENVVHH